MKRHLQCAEQQVSPSNLTKSCACHEKWHCNISEKMSENWWNVISNAGTIREWSDHDPTIIRPWSEHETVSPQPASQPRLFFQLTTRIFYCRTQRFATNLTFKHSPSAAPATKSATWTSQSISPATKSDTSTSPSTAPATKSDTWTSPNAALATQSDTWTSPSAAPATKSDTWTLPNTAPATKSDTRTSPSTLDCLILLTYETSFTMRGATGVPIQPHQILRLPRKMTLQHFRENFRKRMIPMRGRSENDPTMIRPCMIRAWNRQSATRLATEVTFRAHHTHFLL